MNPPMIPHSVAVLARAHGNMRPTPPLDDFLQAYDDDENWWWRIACGHHQNLFDEAVERMLKAEAALKVVP